MRGWWGRHEGSVWGHVDEVIEDLTKSVDEVVRRCEAFECVGVEALGCYLSNAPPDIPGCSDLSGKPVIVVNVNKVSQVVDELIKEVGACGARPESVKRRILKSVIAHEVTHSYTDMAGPESPKQWLSRYGTKFYYSVIEESLATHYELLEALATREPARTLTRYVTHKLLQESTIEYRAGLVWYLRRREHPTLTPDEVLNAWIGISNLTPSIMAYLLSYLEPLLGNILGYVGLHCLHRDIVLWVRH